MPAHEAVHSAAHAYCPSARPLPSPPPPAALGAARSGNLRCLDPHPHTAARLASPPGLQRSKFVGDSSGASGARVSRTPSQVRVVGVPLTLHLGTNLTSIIVETACNVVHVPLRFRNRLAHVHGLQASQVRLALPHLGAGRGTARGGSSVLSCFCKASCYVCDMKGSRLEPSQPHLRHDKRTLAAMARR